ncbi:response regulator [Olivibacter sp. SDN3]|uniref:response regulator transcription factor n=1 Tax=Olivibacter sp. SDN3 TaxID=2764720 RepID=UPI0016519C1D|nr:response regulator [Olivibacter sp. SDN3]QNL47961.1 response regulator [Olivibacter sp. SDN3]
MKETLLIIDDQEDLLEFLTEILGSQYQVFAAIDANKALEILRNQIIHLIISDVMMPGLNGFELCQMLKANIDYCHIPVILLTAKNSYHAKIEGLETGADAYIGKPFSPKLLQVQVVNLLKNRSKIREHSERVPLDHFQMNLTSRSDEVFLQKLNDYICKNMDNQHLGVEELAEHMNMSRPTFYRKMKSISQLSPKDFVDRIRLNAAAKLIAENDYKIFQIANKVGYSSQSVFGKNFQKHFNLSPKAYIDYLKEKLG